MWHLPVQALPEGSNHLARLSRGLCMRRPEPLFLPTVGFLISVVHARLPASFLDSRRCSTIGATSPVRCLSLSSGCLELVSCGMIFPFESRPVFRAARGWETDSKSVSRKPPFNGYADLGWKTKRLSQIRSIAPTNATMILTTLIPFTASGTPNRAPAR